MKTSFTVSTPKIALGISAAVFLVIFAFASANYFENADGRSLERRMFWSESSYQSHRDDCYTFDIDRSKIISISWRFVDEGDKPKEYVKRCEERRDYFDKLKQLRDLCEDPNTKRKNAQASGENARQCHVYNNFHNREDVRIFKGRVGLAFDDFLGDLKKLVSWFLDYIRDFGTFTLLLFGGVWFYFDRTKKDKG